MLQLGEGERCPQVGVGADEAGVDAERVLERAAYVVTEQVVAEACEHGRAMTEPSARGRDVGRGTADRLAEGLDIAQRNVQLFGIEVDTDPANREELEVGHRRRGLSADRAGGRPSPG